MAQQVVISFNANANFSDLIGEIRRANAEIATLQTQLNGLGSSSYSSIQTLNQQFIEGMKNSRMWSSSFVNVTNETREFGRHLDQGRLKLKDYFREFNLQVRGQRGMIRRLAEEQVKLQRSILTTTVGPQGETRNILSTPTGLDRLDPATMKALRAEQFKIIGRAVQGVSTEIINLGKNTQWAGRQLTVGLTIPLAIFAKTAADSFRQVDQQLVRLQKVYGDVGGATSAELARIREQTLALSRELAASLGAPIQETLGLAADIAATGATGDALLRSVAETTRLAVLGEVDRAEAMKATLAIQNAFKQSTDELADSINFLNAVENQTSTSLDDLVTAIPKAGPVVKGLGGSIQDLALFLVAMREGGINATEAANALKSGLASIINPAEKTREMLNGMGIDIENIVVKNAGDLVGTVTALQKALNELDPLSRARAIEQLFGKFQFARISALFDNLGQSGSQTLQVMELMGASTVELAAIADRELSVLTESASGKFARQIETFKANIAVAGEGFLGIFTKVISGVNKVLEGFNNLPEGLKTVITIVGALVGLAGPLIMLSGVFLNFFGYVIKGIGALGRLFTGTKKFELLDEQLMAVSLSGDKMSTTLFNQAKAAESARLEIDRLIQATQRLTEVQNTAATGAAMTGGLRFRPEEGTRTGDIRFRSEFSHLIPQSTLREQYGGITNLMMTQGALIPRTSEFPQAGAFQQAMSTNMPGLIVDREERAGALRPYAEKFGALSIFNDLNEKELSALMPSLEVYAKSQSQQLATWRVFQNLNKTQADTMQKEMLRAMQSGDAELALQAVRNAAAAQGLNFDEIALGYEEIGRAAYASGTDLESRSRNIITKFGELESGLINADSEMKNWLFTSSGNSTKLAQNLARLTAMSTTQIQTAMQAAQTAVNAQLSTVSTTVKTGTKKFGDVTISFVDGVMRIVNQAGTVFTEAEVQSNGKLRNAIQRLRISKEKLEQETLNEVIESIVELDTASTALGSDNAAEAAGRMGIIARIRQGYATGGMRGAARGVGLTRGFGTSMAMMGLGVATSAVPQTGAIGNIAGGALMGASMGMMFGPQGAAVGAALGALVPVLKLVNEEFKRMAAIQQLAIGQYKIDKDFAKAAGINLKTIADIQLEQLTGKTEDAASALEILAQAAMQAGLETSTGQLRTAVEEADTFADVSGEFRSQYLSYIAAGVSEEMAKRMMAAILKAAGREEFATDLKLLINELGRQTQQTSTAQLLRETANPLRGTRYEQVFERLNQTAAQTGITGATAERIVTSTNSVPLEGYSPEARNAITLLRDAYNQLNEEQQEFILKGRDVAGQIEVLSNALANQSAKDFADNMAAAGEAGTITGEAVDGVVESITGLTEVDKSVLQNFKTRGVESADVMLALKMRVEGTVSSLEELAMFDGKTIRLFFEARQTELDLEEAKSNLRAALESAQNVGGASPNVEAQKKAIQAQLDALEEIERKEKNINRLRELAIKHEEKRRNLVLDYLSAMSAGDLEGALRAQIAMQEESVAFARERAQAEKEIAREDRKKALQDKLKALDGSAGNAIKNATNKAKELELSINSAIASTLDGFKGKDGQVTSTFDQFVKSEAFTNFESRFKNILSPEAYTAAIAALKAGFKALEAELNLQAAGIDFGMGTRKAPREVTGYVQGLGVARAAGKDGVQTALSSDQKKVILDDIAKSGQILEGEYVTIFGERYRFDGSDLIRQKNAEGKWSGGKVRGYFGGGKVYGPGNTVSDSVWIKASRDEYVVKAAAAKKLGYNKLDQINAMNYREEPQVVAGGDNVKVYVNKIEILQPGASADEIIATMEKKLFAAKNRKMDKRYLSV